MPSTELTPTAPDFSLQELRGAAEANFTVLASIKVGSLTKKFVFGQTILHVLLFNYTSHLASFKPDHQPDRQLQWTQKAAAYQKCLEYLIKNAATLAQIRNEAGYTAIEYMQKHRPLINRQPSCDSYTQANKTFDETIAGISRTNKDQNGRAAMDHGLDYADLDKAMHGDQQAIDNLQAAQHLNFRAAFYNKNILHCLLINYMGIIAKLVKPETQSERLFVDAANYQKAALHLMEIAAYLKTQTDSTGKNPLQAMAFRCPILSISTDLSAKKRIAISELLSFAGTFADSKHTGDKETITMLEQKLTTRPSALENSRLQNAIRQ